MDNTGQELRLGKSLGTSMKSVYINLYKGETGCTEWYKIELSNKKKVHQSKSIYKFATVNFQSGVFYAAADSVLFSVGGTTKKSATRRRMASDDASFYDLYHKENRFVKLPQMLAARSYGYAMVLQQKLFVLCGSSSENILGEYYDLSLNGGNWSKIDPPQSLTPDCLGPLYAVAYGKNRIFVVFKNSEEHVTYIYNIEFCTWEACQIPSTLLSYRNERPIIVKDTLYWINFGHVVCAYNLVSHEFAQTRVEGLIVNEKFPRLVHLGNKLFATFTIDSGEQTDLELFSNLRVIRLRISEPADGHLDAFICSTRSFPIESLHCYCEILNVMSLNCSFPDIQGRLDKSSGRTGASVSTGKGSTGKRRGLQARTSENIEKGKVSGTTSRSIWRL